MLDLQRLAQLLERACEPRVDGADRKIERVGDLRGRHPDSVAEHDDDTALERELGHGGEQAAVSRRMDGPEVGQVRKLLVRKTTLGTQKVERAVGDNAVQPRPERTTLVEAAERGKRAFEPVCGDVVRERPPPGDSECSSPCVAPVATEERSGGVSVAATRPPYEIPVTWLTHSSAVLYVRTAFARPARGILPA